MKMFLKGLAAGAFALAAATAAQAEDVMKMSVTTSFANSGLADVLLPEIKKDLGLEVQLLIVGTGQALKLGAAGDVDAVLVHSKPAELKWLSEGNGPHRTEIMYNDFVFVGPADDPAGIADAANAAEALRKIKAAEAAFVSRGDDSGTHKKEKSLWTAAGIAPEGDWYRAVGAGMGASLNTAAGMGAYIMSDRASWLNFGNKDGMALLFAGDPVLFNQYAYMPVSTEKHPHAKGELAAKLEGWLLSPRAKELIDGYRLGGEQLFTYNAQPMD
ncbi:substrate-binding domain-containing protein [Rhodovulum sp. DZ06]|uniref:substrate-binding domain-containing protein n=1 Tax=Rhodovulum sp. DZ06 TaxID=3425126 RepID=UPI003D34E9A4